MVFFNVMFLNLQACMSVKHILIGLARKVLTNACIAL